MENEYLIKILLSVLLLLQAVDSKSYQTYNGYGKGFDDYASHKLFSRRQSRYPTGIFKKFPRSRSPFSLEGKMSRSFARSYDTEHFLKDRERESSIRESRYKEPRHESPRLYKHPRRMDPVHKDMKYKDPRFKVPRYEDIKYKDPRHKEPRHTDPRFKDPRYNDLKYKDPRYKDPRQKERKYKDPRLKDLSFPFRDLRKSRADWYKNRKISSVMPSRMEVSKSNSGKPREEFVYPHLGSAKSLFSSRKRPDKINRYPFDLSTYSKNKFRFSPAALSKARYNSREGRSEIEKRLLSRPPTSKARGKTKHYIRFNRYSDTIEGKKLSAYLDAMKEESDKAFMKTVYGLGMQKMVPDLEAIYYTDKDGKKRRKLYGMSKLY